MTVAIFVTLFTKGIVTYPLVVGPLVLAIVGWAAIRSFRDRALLRIRGYRVVRTGRDSICYQELVDGQLRKLIVDGELMARAPHALYIPSDSEWQATTPDWARDRKGEIVARVKEELGAKRYQFVEH